MARAAAPPDLFRPTRYTATTMHAITSPAQVSGRPWMPFGSQSGVQAVLVDPLASTAHPRNLVDQLRDGGPITARKLRQLAAVALPVREAKPAATH